MRPQVSILLICERAEQLTGSGCCGKLEGDDVRCGELFSATRSDQEACGILYRTVRRLFRDAVEEQRIILDTVDPRNQLYLVPRLVSDVWRYRPGWRAGLQAIFQLFSIPAVIVNGRVLGGRNVPFSPDMLCHEIAMLLERRADRAARSV